MIRWVGAPILGALLLGCYTFLPVSGPPAPGMDVAFDVNDAGRVALGGVMGPEIGRIEGRVLERGTEDFLIAVSSIRLLRGGEQVWNGEPVRIRAEHVGPASERRFARGRTVALGVGVIGGFAAFLITRSLIGAGTEDGNPPVDTANTRIIRPRR